MSSVLRYNCYTSNGRSVLLFDAEGLDSDPEYVALKKARGLNTEDQVVINRHTIHISNKLEPDYDRRMQVFTSEHLHPDVEVRFISAGSGYFDMRSRDDRWIRLELSEGDLLVIPGGAYHRFSLDKK
ncbi:1,2-dihydroxy-3-keto-5-methylthiopentene dioxygenase, partial [Elysia marginata]